MIETQETQEARVEVARMLHQSRCQGVRCYGAEPEDERLAESIVEEVARVLIAQALYAIRSRCIHQSEVCEDCDEMAGEVDADLRGA